MKTTAVATSILASAMAVSAQDVQSKPFNLQLESKNETVNNQYVGACHSGAGIESLCLTSRPVTMHINNTSTDFDSYGVLTWLLPSSQPIDSAMRLVHDPSSNVAQAMFYPGRSEPQYVSFKEDYLVLTSNVDDTKVPVENSADRDLDQWYICDSYYTGYRYKTLSWVYGVADPQNPTCVKVSVKRHYE